MPDTVESLYEEADRLYYDGALDQAAEVYKRILEIDPDYQPAVHSLGIIHYDQDDYGPAVDYMQRALALDPEDVYVHSNLGKSLYGMVHMGDRDKAEAIARDWMREFPRNRIARHMGAAVTGDSLPDRANDAYVAQTFDEFADTFEEKLEELEYKAPALLAEALKRHVEGEGLRILDAGCGTGLCAPLLAPMARRLEGIDLSEEMLALARKRKLYKRLDKAELTGALASRAGRYDVVVAADVLCYFGALEAVFKAMRKSLKKGGLLALTLETEDLPQPFQLNISGRYAHDGSYVETALTDAGFDIAEQKVETLRTEYAEPVTGLVLVAVRT